MNRISHCFILIILLLLNFVLFSDNVDQQKINLEDKILKEGKFFNFGCRGFGLYDKGSKSFKIFDWDFKLLREIKINAGEGPGEFKGAIGCACWTTDNHIILNGSNEYLLNKFNSAGTFVGSYRSDFMPLYIKAIEGKLYVVSRLIEMNRNEDSFLQIIDMANGKIIKKSKFKEIPEAGAPDVGYDTAHFNVFIDDKGITNILYGASAKIYRFTIDGDLINTINLPFEDKQRTKQSGNVVIVKWHKIYKGLMESGDKLYVGFIEYNYKNRQQSTCRILKISPDGMVKTGSPYIGYYTMVGGDEEKIILFERDDYFGLPVAISNL